MKYLAGTVCIIAALSSTVSVGLESQAKSQEIATTLAIGAVKDALESSLNSFKSTIQTAGGEINGAGNSLQANAQNVLADIDRIFGKNLNLTFDRMSLQQRALYRDAQRLTQQIRQASFDVLHKTGEEARHTIAEADITAYNASYSLPCRNQTARIVYSTPARIRLGRHAAEVTVRGNFLDGPQNAVALVDGVPAKIISRSAAEIRVALPQRVVSSIKDQRSVRVELPLVDQKRTNLWVACLSGQKTHQASTAILIAPPRFVTIAGWVQPSQLVDEITPKSEEFNSGAPGDCDINVDVSKQICAPEGYTIADIGGLQIISANGGSSAGPATASGDRCIFVPGRHQGAGYDHFPFGIKNCKGRGWIHWKLGYSIKKSMRTPSSIYRFNLPAADQASWNVVYPDYENLRSADWKYAVSAIVAAGSQVRTYEISDAQDLSGPISARLNNGILTVTYDETVDDEISQH